MIILKLSGLSMCSGRERRCVAAMGRCGTRCTWLRPVGAAAGLCIAVPDIIDSLVRRDAEVKRKCGLRVGRRDDCEPFFGVRCTDRRWRFRRGQCVLSAGRDEVPALCTHEHCERDENRAHTRLSAGPLLLALIYGKLASLFLTSDMFFSFMRSSGSAARSVRYMLNPVAGIVNTSLPSHSSSAM